MKLDMQVDSKELQRAFARAPGVVKAGVNDWVKRTALRTERQAKMEVPVDQGILQNSIRTSLGNMTATVKPVAEYALPVHEGTGVYGPKKRPITPRSGKVLSFVVGGQRIFVRSIKGQKPQPFMDDAYKIVKPQVDRDAVNTLNLIVGSI